MENICCRLSFAQRTPGIRKWLVPTLPQSKLSACVCVCTLMRERGRSRRVSAPIPRERENTHTSQVAAPERTAPPSVFLPVRAHLSTPPNAIDTPHDLRNKAQQQQHSITTGTHVDHPHDLRNEAETALRAGGSPAAAPRGPPLNNCFFNKPARTRAYPLGRQDRSSQWAVRGGL